MLQSVAFVEVKALFVKGMKWQVDNSAVSHCLCFSLQFERSPSQSICAQRKGCQHTCQDFFGAICMLLEMCLSSGLCLGCDMNNEMC